MAKSDVKQFGPLLVARKGQAIPRYKRVAQLAHWRHMTLEQRAKWKEITSELKRLERAWTLLESLSPASKNYVRDRLNDA